MGPVGTGRGPLRRGSVPWRHVRRSQESRGPLIAVSATDISTGSRLVFIPQNFNVLCADLGPIRLSRAAAASSAVPVVLSAVTINNYGGTCGYQVPPELARFATEVDPPRPAARMLGRINELQEFSDGEANPYLHLVDGGISDNLGLRSVLDLVQSLEALHEAGIPTPLDHVRRIVVFVVNSLSAPTTDWNKREEPPGLLDTLIQASGVPIDRYSGEGGAAERHRGALENATADPRLGGLLQADAASRSMFDNALYAIDVSFPALKDKVEQRIPEPAADVVRAFRRGGGPPAGGRLDDHPQLAGLPGPAYEPVDIARAADGQSGAQRGALKQPAADPPLCAVAQAAS